VLRNGKLDVGGFGKGWAIDQVAALLNNEGMKEYLINAGGDMYGTSERGQPITIYLEHPTTPNWYLEQTTLFHQGFAASTRTKRQWRHHNQTYSHIIDTTPTHLVSPDYDTGVFIKASQTVMADAFATTGLLIPPDTLFALATIHELGVAIYQPSTQSLQPNLAFTKNSHDVS
jgi:thiamine biosynthesis lipoprotein